MCGPYGLVTLFPLKQRDHNRDHGGELISGETYPFTGHGQADAIGSIGVGSVVVTLGVTAPTPLPTAEMTDAVDSVTSKPAKGARFRASRAGSFDGHLDEVAAKALPPCMTDRNGARRVRPRRRAAGGRGPRRRRLARGGGALHAHAPGLPPRAPQLDAHRRRPGSRQRRDQTAYQGGVGLSARRVAGQARRGRPPRPERRAAARAELHRRPQPARGLRVARTTGGGGRAVEHVLTLVEVSLHGQAR